MKENKGFIWIIIGTIIVAAAVMILTGAINAKSGAKEVQVTSLVTMN